MIRAAIILMIILTVTLGDAPLTPTFVRTVSFRPESPERYVAHLTALVMILCGFCCAIAAMLWVALRRKGVSS